MYDDKNFVELYQYCCVNPEVPEIYNRWCAYVVLAAAMRDKVWFELFKGDPLKPNLFVGLIGPGSAGKGQAIGFAQRLFKKSCPEAHSYSGKLTYARLIDHMAGVQDEDGGWRVEPKPQLWLVMEELMNGVGGNAQLVAEFIALLTDLYTSANDTMQTGTRGRGDANIVKPCLNWTFGSNKKWLKKVLPKDDLETGFIARTCFVIAEPDLSKRVWRPTYPSDWEMAYTELIGRLAAIHYTWSGGFQTTEGADAMLASWYESRPLPDEELLASVWKRQREFILRFSMIAAASDNSQLLIRTKHVCEGLELLDEMLYFATELIGIAAEGRETAGTNEVLDYIKTRGEIGHAELLRQLRKIRGLNKRTVIEALEAGENEGLIEASKTQTGAKSYVWLGREE